MVTDRNIRGHDGADRSRLDRGDADDYFRLGDATRAQQQRLELCTGWAQMVEKIRTRY
jgi:hypothetical protein